jgi:adhesin HecA-like repeat protein
MTQTPQNAQVALNLNSAAGFAVLAGTEITNTGSTTICGKMGIYPDTTVTGSVVYTCSGGLITNSTAQTGQSDLTTAYNNAAARPNGAAISGDLGGLTIYPGLYNTAGTIGITGDLTLDAQGNTNAIFIFQIGSSLTTASSGNIILANGATAANIFWQVGSSCSIGANSAFIGTILAYTSISFGSGATLSGRALCENGEVSLIGDTITNPTP